MKTIEKLGSTWTVENDCVVVYLWTEGRDASSVAWGCQNWQGWGYDAEEATADNCPPEAPSELVVARVPVARFDEFIVSLTASDEDHYLFPTVDDAWDSENGEVEYEDTPWGKALAAMTGAHAPT